VVPFHSTTKYVPHYGQLTSALDLMNTTKRQIEAFTKFLDKLPHGKDTELVILKGHLLIEEQVRTIIERNINNPEALITANLTCHQAICIAQALLPAGHEKEFWEAAKKLNTIRNDIAHNIDIKGLQDKIDHFTQLVPVNWEGPDKQATFELSIWSLFVYISSFVEGEVSEHVKSLIPVKSNK